MFDINKFCHDGGSVWFADVYDNSRSPLGLVLLSHIWNCHCRPRVFNVLRQWAFMCLFCLGERRQYGLESDNHVGF